MIFIKGKRVLKRIIIGIIVLIIALMSVFVLWAKDTYKPVETEYNTDIVDMQKDEYIVFKPKNVECKKGFIFYPGAKVESESYTELCSKIAEEGYLVVIAPMTLDLAILSPNKADDIIAKYSDIESWAIGGHSLGGVMAANYASKHEDIKGVVFYASYPQGNAIKNLDIKVLSIYGSNDGVADLDKVRNASLPKESEVVEIKGGNHAGFGSYGSQKGDNEADITNIEQINEAANYTVEFLEKL